MCGIIGYVGDREAAPIIMESLKRLEYRGYDSAGVAVFNEGKGRGVIKTAGKVADLERELATGPALKGRLGIGHTRWATHGKPTSQNAHPHWDCHGKIMVIHNGIIENFGELKRELQQKGHKFRTETDTEVVPHLIEEIYKGDLVEACRKAISRLQGAYSLVIFSHDEPDLLIGARLNAPLMVGLGKKEWFICSDLTGIIPYTKKALVLGEGQMVAITKLGPVVTDLTGVAVQPKVVRVTWDVSQAQKGGYPHYMLKEINEDAEAVRNAVRGHLDDEGNVTFPEFNLSDRKLLKFDRIVIVGAGSSLTAGTIGKYAIEDLARIPVEVEGASEFRYRHPLVDEKLLLVALSQSGETADTIAAIREARAQGATVVSICNVVGSSMTMESDGVIYMQSGPEIGVCSSKTFIGHVTTLILLAIRLAAVRHRLAPEQLERLTKGLHEDVPRAVEKVLRSARSIHDVARKYKQSTRTSCTSAGASTTPWPTRARSRSRRSPTSTPRATPPGSSSTAPSPCSTRASRCWRSPPRRPRSTRWSAASRRWPPAAPRWWPWSTTTTSVSRAWPATSSRSPRWTRSSRRSSTPPRCSSSPTSSRWSAAATSTSRATSPSR